MSPSVRSLSPSSDPSIVQAPGVTQTMEMWTSHCTDELTHLQIYIDSFSRPALMIFAFIGGPTSHLHDLLLIVS